MNTNGETPPGPESLIHGLRWGIKSSFVDYVRRMPDGKGSVGDGAIPVGAGELFFEYDGPTSIEATAAADDGHEVIAFRGDVRFSGHYGMLFVRIAHPRLEIHGNQAVLTIEDPQARAGVARVALVALELQHVETREGTEVRGSDKVVLTAAGVEMFNDVYAEGELFEPLLIQIPTS